MTQGLLDPLRHNSWATRELIGFCRDLKPDQLAETSEGTYGSILSTLQHIIGAESRYRFRLSGKEVGWPRKPEDTDDLEELSGMNDDNAAFYEQLASNEFDPDRVIHAENPDEEYEVSA